MHTRSRFSTAAIAGTVLGVAVLGGAPALAAWSKSGSGAGAAQATSLGAPTNVTAAAAGSNQINITWGGPVAGPTPTTYQVVRTDSSNASTTLGCTTSPCNDTTVAPSSTYSYVVSSKLGNWITPAGAKSATTSAAVNRATTTTLSSSQSPSRNGSSVTFTATVTPTSGTGTPSGTVTFKDGSTTISCTNLGGQTLSSSSPATATCATGSLSVGLHSVTAVYGGDSTFTTSTSNAVGQRVTNAAGLVLTSVSGGTGSPTCSGLGTASLSCTYSAAPNNATVSAGIGFVNASGAATAYATDVSTAVTWSATGKATPNSGSLPVATGAQTSGASVATAQKNGSNAVTITYTFTSGDLTYTATLTTTN